MRIHSVVKGVVAGFLALASVPAMAQSSKDFSVAVGAAGVYRNVFKGSDRDETTVKPLLDIKWRNAIEVEDYDMRINVYAGRHYKLGVILSYDEGRSSAVTSDARTSRIHSVDPTAMGGIFASYFFDTWKFDFRLQQDIINGSSTNGGYFAQAGVAFGAKISPEAKFTVGPRFTYGSDDYMQAYHGVTAADTARTGIKRFTPSAGMRDAAFVGKFTYDITRNWIAMLSLEYGALMGDAKDSPLTKSDTFGVASMGMMYKF